MLVKYVMNSSATYSDIVTDITGIITGTVTSNSSLSSSANSAATTFYGTYPSGYYAVANSSSFTYSKEHSANTSELCYFRLGFDGAYGIANLTLGGTYTSGSDTVSNAFSYTFPTYSVGLNSIGVDPASTPIDIIVNTTGIYLHQPTLSNRFIGVCDLGYNGVSKTFTDSMVNGLFQFSLDNIYGSGPNITIPYGYKFTDSSNNNVNYGTYGLINSGFGITTLAPTRPLYDNNANTAVCENPVFFFSYDQANLVSTIYGFNSIANGLYGPRAVYKDGNNIYRYVIPNYGQNYSITIT